MGKEFPGYNSIEITVNVAPQSVELKCQKPTKIHFFSAKVSFFLFYSGNTAKRMCKYTNWICFNAIKSHCLTFAQTRWIFENRMGYEKLNLDYVWTFLYQRFCVTFILLCVCGCVYSEKKRNKIMDENNIYRWYDESGMKRSHYIDVKWWTDGEMMRIKREVEKYGKMWKPILISGALNTQHAIWTMITWTKCKRSWLCRAHVRTIIWDVSSVLENQQRRRHRHRQQQKVSNVN